MSSEVSASIVQLSQKTEQSKLSEGKYSNLDYLKFENNQLIILVVNLNEDNLEDHAVPVFDKSVDYVKLMVAENARMSMLKQQLEVESNSYFATLKQVLQSQINLNREIKLNEHTLRKRDQKNEEILKDKLVKCARPMLSER